MIGKLTIKANIPEGSFVEGLLNMKHSGVIDNHIMFLIGMYALAHRWHIDKLFYYLDLLEIKSGN